MTYRPMLKFCFMPRIFNTKMRLHRIHIYLTLLGLVSLGLQAKCDTSIQDNSQKNHVGYKAISRYEDEFIAVGTDGKIDRISISGKVTKSEKFAGEKFNCIISNDRMTLAAGDRGILLISSEKGIFRRIESNTKENINSLVLFRGNIVAVTDHGEIISGDGKSAFKRTRLPVKGNIVSVSARESECFGVTDEGEIIHTTNGIKWEITDFNKAYAGYYKTSYFTKILVTENRIAIAGKHNDDSPVLLLSTQGNVWTERTLVYTDDQGYNNILEDSPNDIIYNESEDMFYLACNRGRVFQLPSCNHCNKLAIVSEESLMGISSNENILMIVGENFIIKNINLKW